MKKIDRILKNENLNPVDGLLQMKRIVKNCSSRRSRTKFKLTIVSLTPYSKISYKTFVAWLYLIEFD